jgi:amino acid transporter
MADNVKRLLIGRKLRSSQQGETLLSKKVALPVFASDALSSVAYSPDEIFIVLAAAGLSAYALTWKVGIAVALVMLVVVASYRQNVQAYTSGGGDYEVSSTNLGPTPGLMVGSALLVDYVLTVAVSISSAAQYAASAVEGLRDSQVFVAVLAVLLLTAVNLRGVRESGVAFAVPTYCSSSRSSAWRRGASSAATAICRRRERAYEPVVRTTSSAGWQLRVRVPALRAFSPAARR